MTTRKIIDAKQNGEKVWLKGHAQAIYMSDGSTVEDAINNIKANGGGGGNIDLSDYETKLESQAKLQEAKSYTDNKTDELRDVVTQTLSLISGTDWYSFYVDITLEQLQQALGTNATTITTSFDGTTEVTSSYDADTNTWSGDLTTLDVTKMYMIAVNTDCEISLTGRKIPNSTSYTLNPGWNWIGYPVSESANCETALADLASKAKLGDRIRSRNNGYLEFYENANTGFKGWAGELESFVPGQGYMYYNASESVKNLIYTIKSIDVKSELSKKQNTLVSGTNIKTINGESVLGSGDISISNIKWSILKNISTVGDVAYWDGNKVKTVPLSNWNPSLGTPVGVVVIPDNFLPDNRARIVSLVNMVSEYGGEQLDWYFNEAGHDDTPLINFNSVPITNNNGAITGNEMLGYLPSDNYTSTTSYDDPLSNYASASSYLSSLRIPSPYLGDKGLNPSYSDSSFANALSDFNGLSNTETLFNFVPTNGGIFGAACACYEYKDSAESNLQWYLPSLGELGFLITRLRTITSSITAVGGIELTTNIDVGYWSSTELSYSTAWGVFIHNGHVGSPATDLMFGYVRAFALI